MLKDFPPFLGEKQEGEGKGCWTENLIHSFNKEWLSPTHQALLQASTYCQLRRSPLLLRLLGETDSKPIQVQGVRMCYGKGRGQRLGNYEVGVPLCEGWGQRSHTGRYLLNRALKEVMEWVTRTSTGDGKGKAPEKGMCVDDVKTIREAGWCGQEGGQGERGGRDEKGRGGWDPIGMISTLDCINI